MAMEIRSVEVNTRGIDRAADVASKAADVASRAGDAAAKAAIAASDAAGKAAEFVSSTGEAIDLSASQLGAANTVRAGALNLVGVAGDMATRGDSTTTE